MYICMYVFNNNINIFFFIKFFYIKSSLIQKQKQQFSLEFYIIICINF